MSQHPLILGKPKRIRIDTLPELFAHHRARFGGWTMTATPPEPDPPKNDPPMAPAPPERPDDIPEDTWSALGDPGKQAIVRERERANAAERALAASRARPAPPANDPPKADPPKADPPKPADKDGKNEPDIAAIIKQAVTEAVQPFQAAEQQRQAETAAEKVRQAVIDAAKPRLHDATDALSNVDLVSVVNDQGGADADKIKTAIDDLVVRKPHLAKTQQRQAPPGIGGGAPAGATDAEKVKAVLADMQRATGVRLEPSGTSNT